jgi:ATP-dependent DNA helicase Rep
MQDLNTPQREAVKHLGSPLLVLAGAGSGKTRVITRKIAYLIEQCDMMPRNIAAVTFTNKAAREMKSRVAELMNQRGSNSRGLLVSTFHNLGLTILRRDFALLGYRPGFSIFDAQDSLAVLRDIMGQDFAADSDHASRCQWQISEWKNDLKLPDQAASQAEDADQVAAAAVYVEYEKALLAYNAVDFDDLITKPVMLFQQHEKVLSYWQNRIRYLLVDEYQDTNGSQYALVTLLVGKRGALTVVGDDDQSVYSWRGARPENLLQLQADYTDLKVVKLEQNYRSVSRILRAANALISHNPHIFEKKLWSDMGEGDPIRVIGCRNEDHEAEKVVTELLFHKMKRPTEYKDYAILYRGNHQSRPIERILREMDVPYFITGGQSFFARSEIKDIMAYLRLVANQDDDNAFLRVINTPRRGIGPKTLQILGNYAGEREISLFSACFEMGLTTQLSTAVKTKVIEFSHWLVDIADRVARTGDLVDTLRDMIEEINYRGWLEEVTGDPMQAERRMENITELLAWVERLLKREEGDMKEIGDIAARLTLMDIMERQAEENQDDAVSLMTLHAAKGLEFPHVFIMGMEEEILPHKTSIEEENVEEERRLAYVGVTRAQRSLTFMMAKSRKRYGEKVSCEPSRFLMEMPEQDLAWETEKTPVDPVKRKERGNMHLSKIREMLK